MLRKPVAILDRTGLDPSVLEPLRAELLRQEILEDVLRWAAQLDPPRTLEDVVVQDEYSHDVLLPYEEGLYLVYGTSWLGAVLTVSVWDHRPTAQELLDARLALGWKPTPSLLNEGERVLGFAACLFDRQDADRT